MEKTKTREEELFLQKRKELLETICHIRRSKGISLNRLAEMTGMNKGYLSRIESANVSPGLHNIVRLCAALGVDLVLRDSERNDNSKT